MATKKKTAAKGKKKSIGADDVIFAELEAMSKQEAYDVVSRICEWAEENGILT